MSTQPPSGQDPYDPRYPERLPPGFTPPSDEFPRYPTGPGRPGGAGAGDPLVATDLAGWFERIVGVIRRSLAPLLVLQGGYALISVVFQLLYGDKLAELAKVSQTDPQAAMPQLEAVATSLILPGLAIMLISLFVTAASMWVIIRQAAAGGVPSIGHALAFAGRRMPLLIAWAIAAFLLVMIGFMLFFLPGILLVLVFAGALLGAVVVERRGIDRVFPLVVRRFPATLGRGLLLGATFVVYSGVVNVLVSGIGPGPDSFVGAVLGAVLGIPLGLAQAAFFVVTYAELRHHENPEVGTPQLAAEMDA
jgi:hypothetical protein